MRGFNRADGAQHEPGRADALKIHVAREVIAARPQGFEWWRQPRLELDETADRRRRALAHRYPHALEMFAQSRP